MTDNNLDVHLCEGSMHDSIALGDYKTALNGIFKLNSDGSFNSRSLDAAKQELILRSPLLFRLLSSSQHLSSIDANGDNALNAENGIYPSNQYIDDIVRLLEMVAASQHSGEKIEHLASFLAPEACRPVSKLLSSSVKRKRKLIAVEREETDSATGTSKNMDVMFGKGVVVTHRYPIGSMSIVTSGWDDSALKEICGESSKRNTENNNGSDSDSPNYSLVDRDDQSNDEDDLEDDDVLDRTNKTLNKDLDGESSGTKRKRKRGLSVLDRKSLEESDNLESAVCKTLLEVLKLVSSSLAPTHSKTSLATKPSSESWLTKDVEEGDAEESDTPTNTSRNKSAAAIKLLPTSLLSEPGCDPSGDSELSATITTVMHHSPIIRHEHLSNALCRASVPHCAIIVKRLAANCPTASMPLLRGCINACIVTNMSDDQKIVCDESLSIVQCARDSMKAIASLSPREAMNTASLLRQSCISSDLMFDIMIDCDPMSAITVLWDSLRTHLSIAEGNNAPQPSQSRTCMSDTLLGALPRKKDASMQIVERMKMDSDFAIRVGMFLVSELRSISTRNTSDVIWGQATLITQLLGMYAVICCPLNKFDFAEASIAVIMTLSNKAFELVHGFKVSDDDIFQDKEGELAMTSPSDVFMKSALSSSFMICLHSFSQAELVENGLPSMAQCFRPFHIWHVSIATRSFASLITDFITHEKPWNTWKLLLNALLSKEEGCSQQHYNLEHLKWVEFCAWAKKILPSSTNANLSMSMDTKALIELGQSDIALDNFDAIIKAVFRDKEKCNLLYEDKDALTLIETTIARTDTIDTPAIPLILPLTINKMADSVLKQKHNSESSEWRQLVIHLVYSFTFSRHYPDSPYSLNPRSLQPRELIRYICESNENFLTRKLLSMIDSFCPELSDQGFDRSPDVQDELANQVSHSKISPTDISRVIRKYLSGDKLSLSADGFAIEQAFLSSRVFCQSGKVDAEVARALLTSVGDSFHFLTYSTLCMDPLVLLKCSLKVWFNNELRRILLLILNRALTANDKLIQETDSNASTVSEYLASRDALLVRSFILLLTSSFPDTVENGPILCPIMISMVRFTLANRQGLVASIIKQGLSEAALDWLIQNVPEILADAPELSSMLESRSLNIVEKLRIADGSLRIIIVHGSGDQISQRLVYNALSALVSSFYIVIGPVGVPVNVLCDEKEQDITQSCREQLFRMLAALQDISSNRKNLKGEAILALSKLASLCKSDVTSGDLSANALLKRKRLLDKVWDSIVKVNEAFGGGVNL